MTTAVVEPDSASEADQRLARLRGIPEASYGPVEPTLSHLPTGRQWCPAPSSWPFAFPEDSERYTADVAILRDAQ